MYLIHTQATSLPTSKLTGAGECYVDHLKAYGDIQHLNRRGSVTYLKPARKGPMKMSKKDSNVGDDEDQDATDEDRDGVNVTRHGVFCRISLKCGGVQSIQAATDEVYISLPPFFVQLFDGCILCKQYIHLPDN